MKLGRRAIGAWLWVLVAVVGGIGIVLVSEEMLLSIVGILAIILGLISLMPALMFTLEDEDERAA